MRAKALLLAAAVSAAALTPVSAATYSVNVVGYINVTVPPGFSIIANQLDNGAGNDVRALLSNLPVEWDGVQLYKYRIADGGWDILSYDTLEDPPNWLPLTIDMTLNPGEAAFISNGSGGDLSATFVGEVMEGDLVVDTPAGFSMVSSMVPQEGTLTELELNGVDGDTVYVFDAMTQNYLPSTFDELEDPPAWLPALDVSVGEGFWINRGAASQWARNFVVPRE
jgi:hypothetical protein